MKRTLTSILVGFGLISTLLAQQITRQGFETSGDGDFDEIHTLGARSITVWNAATGARVWDSGDDFERITAADPVFGPMFNASNAKYLWSTGATTAQITVSTEAIYSVVVTSADGCTASDAIFVDVQVCPATKNPTEIGGLNIFPNPTAGEFFVEITMKKAARADLFLSDAAGRTVKTMLGQSLSEGKNRVEMDGSELPNGLYFLNLKTENGRVSRKIVVARD